MQIPLGNSSLEGVREVGGFGQPLHTLYPQIRAVLASELGPEAACILAEPVVDRTGNRIDWYTEGDPDEKPVRLHALSEDQRRPILDRIEDFLGRGRELAERYAASADPRRVQLGAILQAVLHPPAETDIFLISGQPVMIGWGFALDRPWELTASPVRRPATPMAESAAAPRDVALPDIAMPELTSAAPLEPVPASASQPVIEQREKAPPPLPTLEPVPLKPAPVLPAQPLPPQPEPVPPSEPTPAAVTVSPLPRSEPEPNSAPVSSLRYVVVGSRYFWGVFAFAVLLAVVAAFWLAMGRPSPQSTVGAMLAPLSDTEPDPALTEAQRTERELRTRLESLLVQLAERRGQCSPARSMLAAGSIQLIRRSGGQSRHSWIRTHGCDSIRTRQAGGWLQSWRALYGCAAASRRRCRRTHQAAARDGKFGSCPCQSRARDSACPLYPQRRQRTGIIAATGPGATAGRG